MIRTNLQKVHVPKAQGRTVLQMSGAGLTVGSLIQTARGEMAIEDLKPGNLIVTKDFGMQKLRYIAFQDVDLNAAPKLTPIKVDCRFLGFDQISYLAPDQHLSLRHPMFDVMFGASEVLVRCVDLLDHPGFERVANLASLTYVALGFAHRQIIMCNGAAVEVGPKGLKPARIALGQEEARLAIQLLEPKHPQPKRHSFPLH